jgi:hypothetical protein
MTRAPLYAEGEYLGAYFAHPNDPRNPEPDEIEDDRPLCECDLDLTMEEIDRGRCSCCGRPVFTEVS